MPHSGIDYSADRGTPMVASNRGRVALLGEFFFAGRLVALGHGLALYTLYFHLDGAAVVGGRGRGGGSWSRASSSGRWAPPAGRPARICTSPRSSAAPASTRRISTGYRARADGLGLRGATTGCA